jgi:Glycosyl hydrolase family 79 C-terminal beta domain/Glycosyl hydrolase family 79, N-terminal domain
MSYYQRTTRRNFLITSAGLGGMGLVTLLGQLPCLSDNNSSMPVTITVNSSKPGIYIPNNFTGLSYEANALPRAWMFRPENILLQNFLKQLGSKGVLRIGGNSVENTYWIERKPTSVKERQIITQDHISNLFNFARKIGWKVILGLNLGDSKPEIAALQAEYVVDVAGDRLLSFEIGNEPDLYSLNGLRPKTYDYNDFKEEFSTYFKAIRSRVANAPISGPGTAKVYKTWAVPFAKDATDQIDLLTQHYYRMGPPTNASVTISNLLSPDERLEKMAQNLREVAQQSGKRYRITECNSVFYGGKSGVSNVFASALWGLDFMFTLAQNGAAGVNFHGGGDGLYSPFAILPGEKYIARPLYYGMLLFKLASQGRLLPVTISQTTVNLKAYAVLAQNKNVLLTLINKDQMQNAQVLIDFSGKFGKASALRLTAPSLHSTSDITLGGSSVESDGSWKPQFSEKIQKSGNYYSVLVPASSAILITLG